MSSSHNGGGGRGSGRRNHHRNRNNNHNNNTVGTKRKQQAEDILIQFMPYMRNQHPEALQIHAIYSGDERTFLQEASQFLKRQEEDSLPSALQQLQVHNDPILIPQSNNSNSSNSNEHQRNNRHSLNISAVGTPPRRLSPKTVGPTTTTTMPQSQNPSLSPLPSISIPTSSSPSQVIGSAGVAPNLGHRLSPIPMMMPPPAPSTLDHQQQQSRFGHQSNGTAENHLLPPGITSPSPPLPPGLLSAQGPVPPGLGFRSPAPPGLTPQPQTAVQPAPVGITSTLQQQQQQQQQQQPSPLGFVVEQQQQQQQTSLQPAPVGIVQQLSHQQQPLQSGLLPAPVGLQQNRSSPVPPLQQQQQQTEQRQQSLGKPSKAPYQPKRIWTRLDQQPGRILANEIPAMASVVTLRPRQELTAKWFLPLKYLRERMAPNATAQTTIRDALESLTVGLFRRGCTENGTNASIISKEILAPPDENRSDFPFQVSGNVIFGQVPFYAPRTPGHVLFRLYWANDPFYTLATGPTLYVKVTDQDLEPTLRFILSNFKSKKGSATSLSSLNALATVLESPTHGSAGRAAWGCICESRKVLEACAQEYQKQKVKWSKLEQEIQELKERIAAEQKEEEEENGKDNGNEEEEEGESLEATLREKTSALMGGRAANERKWKDSQVSFASILKAVVKNPSATVLFRRELVAKIKLEFELWCSLCEAFAPSPFNSDPEAMCVDFNQFPQHVTPSHYKQCVASRVKMQEDFLGFVPNRKSLSQVLMGKNNTMDRTAVETFNRISASMGQLYQDCYMVSDRVHKQREIVRSHIESIVAQCDAFPPGTRVVVFGSSANGFGSPSSDLDMCLQMPQGSRLPNAENDSTGAGAMAKLAELLESGGMRDVDTVRLTARIPIIKFDCPRPMAAEGEDSVMECDLSMQNPLACLNTTLLLSYSRIHPVTRVLAAIVKRWAKARDINNPSKHTLSTYGYILMLLHFLTYHKRTGNGLVSPISDPPNSSNPATLSPLLPNLHWMDGSWLGTPPGTPYKELNTMPTQMTKHPLEDDAIVNTYFFRLAEERVFQEIQRRFPSQDLSLAILLASFFRYYAYEFDFKRHVVSLHSTARGGLVEREVKAEINGWRVYSTSLAIEDPFETFYDVAHVVKGANFHRLRNEFAMAYSKIVDATKKKGGPPKTGVELIDLICCEPEVEPNHK